MSPDREFYQRIGEGRDTPEIQALVHPWEWARIQYGDYFLVEIQTPPSKRAAAGYKLYGVLHASKPNLGEGSISIPLGQEGKEELLVQIAEVNSRHLGIGERPVEETLSEIGVRTEGKYEGFVCRLAQDTERARVSIVFARSFPFNEAFYSWRGDMGNNWKGHYAGTSALGLATYFNQVFSGWQLTPIPSANLRYGPLELNEVIRNRMSSDELLII